MNYLNFDICKGLAVLNPYISYQLQDGLLNIP